MITCFWWLAITAWKTPLLPGPFRAPPPWRGEYSSRLDKGQKDLQLFVVWKAFQSPEKLLLLTSVLKVKPVIRCRIRKGCPPVTLQSGWGEDKALVLPFFCSMEHHPPPRIPWGLKTCSLFPTVLEAQNIFGSWAEVLSFSKAWVCGGEMLGGKGCLVTI